MKKDYQMLFTGGGRLKEPGQVSLVKPSLVGQWLDAKMNVGFLQAGNQESDKNGK